MSKFKKGDLVQLSDDFLDGFVEYKHTADGQKIKITPQRHDFIGVIVGTDEVRDAEVFVVHTIKNNVPYLRNQHHWQNKIAIHPDNLIHASSNSMK